MPLPPDILWQHRIKRRSQYLIYAVLLIGLMVLTGWEFNLAFLKTVVPGSTAMNPLTAVCFVLTSVSFLWRTAKKPTPLKQKAAYFFSSLIVLLSILKLCAIILHTGFEPDAYLFADRLLLDSVNNMPSRMSPNTACCFVLTSIALLLLNYETPGKRMPAHYVALVLAFLALLCLLGYLYKVQSFLGIFTNIQMALHTAIGFFLLALAILFANPNGSIMREMTSTLSGSVTARVLMPVAIIIPAALGLLRLWGFWRGYYDHEFGVVLYAAFTIVLFVAFIWYNTRMLNARDIFKVATEKALQASEEESRRIFDNAPDAIVVIDKMAKIVKWNPHSQRVFQWTSIEIIGSPLDKILRSQDKISGEKPNDPEADISGLYLNGRKLIFDKTMDLQGTRKDGTCLDISLSISPLLLNEQQFFIGFLRDITERKFNEKMIQSFNHELGLQVEEKTEELRDIFERIKDGFIALDKNFCYTYMNKKAGELIHRDPASLIGKNVWEIFPDAVNSETFNSFNKALKEQVYISSTDYYEPFDLWQENHIYPSPNGLSIFIRDITEQKRAEKQINEAKNLADKLIDSLPGVFYFYDAHGKFIRWNKQFELVTGFSSEEISLMHPSDFFGKEDKEYMLERIMEVFATGMNDAEAEFVTKSGKKIPYYFKAVLIQYEGQPCLLGTGIDVTERKKAEEELKASEQKYKLLFDSNPLPMWMLSLPGYRVTEVNNSALIQYGYTKEEFIDFDIFNLRPDADIELLKAKTNREFRGIYHAGIWRHQKKDKSILYVDVVTHDIYYEGKPVRLVLAHEVTKQYLSEEKLKDAYEATRKLTEHIQNVREEERLHIAREIHDELGQLLTVLKMDVSWLSKKIEPVSQPVKEKLSELLRLIDTTVKTVRRIASELRPSLIDDLGLMAAMEWHLEEFEKRSGIFKELYLPNNEIDLPDALKIGLFRIFQESLTNVARHSGAQKVNVELKEMGHNLQLTIVDDGKGFDEKKANKNTLGLLGMKERTLAMGGEYSISALPEKGTMVKVIVPLPHKIQEN